MWKANKWCFIFSFFERWTGTFCGIFISIKFMATIWARINFIIILCMKRLSSGNCKQNCWVDCYTAFQKFIYSFWRSQLNWPIKLLTFWFRKKNRKMKCQEECLEIVIQFNKLFQKSIWNFFIQLTTWIFVRSICAVFFAVTEETSLNTVSITASQESILTKWLIGDQQGLHFTLLIL